MHRAFIFTPVVAVVLYGIWLAGTGALAFWDVGAFIVYTLVICTTVYAASFIPVTLVFALVAGTALGLEIWYIYNQLEAGNITEEVRALLLIAVIVALLMERGDE